MPCDGIPIFSMKAERILLVSEPFFRSDAGRPRDSPSPASHPEALPARFSPSKRYRRHFSGPASRSAIMPSSMRAATATIPGQGREA